MNVNRVLIEAILHELQNRQELRRLNRNLRDASNPFETPEELFKKLYRLDVQTAQDLFNELLPFLNQGRRNTSIPSVLRFFSTITFLAHGSYQKPVAQDKSVACSQSTISRHLHEIINMMVNHLGNRYIRFPQTLEEIIMIKQGFFAKHGIPGIIGCIDCTHVKIVPPSFRQLGYPPNFFLNRKNFYSLNCQLMLDILAAFMMQQFGP
nr:PREDICTED: putative nuclease HARBI1 [Linepithema humile]